MMYYTDRQFSILKFCLKKPTLGKLKTKFNISDYLAFQTEFDNEDLFNYSDYRFEDNTIVSLKNKVRVKIEEEIKERRKYWFQLIISNLLALATLIVTIINSKD